MEMIKDDCKLLEKEAQKVKSLQEQLEEEERKYAETAAELAADLQYEAEISKEEQKLKELHVGVLS